MELIVKELKEFVVALNNIKELDDNNILLILNLTQKFFKTENCLWISSIRKSENYNLLSKPLNKTDKLVTLNINSGNLEEKLILINPDFPSNLLNEILVILKSILENISNNDNLIKSLKNKFYIDSLTQVYNNEALLERLNFKQEYMRVGVCFIDVNCLGIINNTYGHEAGDVMLKTIAEVICMFIRKNNVYRKGGDEFVIICEDIDENLFNEKIASISEALKIHNYSISYGITYAEITNDLETMIKEADSKMYTEKEKFRKLNPSKYLVRRKN